MKVRVQSSESESRIMNGQEGSDSARVRMAMGELRDLAWPQELLGFQVLRLAGSGQPIFGVVLSFLCVQLLFGVCS